MNHPSYDHHRFVETAAAAYDTANSQLSVPLEISASRPSIPLAASQLEPYLASADRAGFRRLDVTAADIPNIPALMGRVLLAPNSRLQCMSPAVVMPQPGQPRALQLLRLEAPYDPLVGISNGYRLGLSMEAQTRDGNFGGHNSNGQAVRSDGGHFTVAAMAARSREQEALLIQGGDSRSDSVIAGGLPAQLKALGMLGTAAIATSQPINPADLPQGCKLPLFWHESLEADNGPAAADYPNAARLMVGSAINAISHDGGLRRADQLAQVAVERSRYA